MGKMTGRPKQKNKQAPKNDTVLPCQVVFEEIVRNNLFVWGCTRIAGFSGHKCHPVWLPLNKIFEAVSWLNNSVAKNIVNV